MDAAKQKTVRAIPEEFTAHNNLLSISVLIFDFALYISLTALAVLTESFWVKIPAVVGAGTAISMLFILGHDAAHRSLVSSRRANTVLTRLVFLPCLHNPSLWQIEHNWTHHQYTNVKGRNSFSPMTPNEFMSASILRQWLERLYRSVAGFGLYYLVERWWKHKFIPFGPVPFGKGAAAWRDLGILLIWLAGLCTALVWVDASSGGNNPHQAVLWGFVAPFLVWNQLMGTTAFLQHTHPRVTWSADLSNSRTRANQAEVTILVQFPWGYDYLSHNIMQHPVHHVNPRIPWFRLKKAQRRLSDIAEAEMIIEHMGLQYLWVLTRDCQLYDYEGLAWVTFAGSPSKAANSQRTGELSKI